MNFLAAFPQDDSALHSVEVRKNLTKILMRLLNEWDLSTAHQLRLLGLRETSRNMLIKYRNLESVIPYEQDKLDRVALLFAIYKNLYDLFPENKHLRQSWVKRKNKHLENKKPLDLMLEKGIFGFAYVMRYLDLQKVH